MRLTHEDRDCEEGFSPTVFPLYEGRFAANARNDKAHGSYVACSGWKS